MAKLFYSFEETAQKLGISEEQLKSMASSGKLQAFRDRDKVMFKREQVDALGAKSSDAESSDGPIPLASSDDTAKIELAEPKPPTPPGPGRKDDPRQATGISVFDADEVEAADPLAQTQITKPPAAEEEELSIESVGSGSGLLDLTKESDDTSLGAELLDEIYPGSSGEASDAKLDQTVAAPGGGSLESALQTEAASSTGLENLEIGASTGMIALPPAGIEAHDPAGSGLSLGFLIGAAIALGLLLFVAIPALMSVPTALTAAIGASTGSLLIYAIALLVASIIFGLLGFFVGKRQG